jgi:hypothetical protein
LIHDIKKKLQVCHEVAISNLIKTKQKRIESQRDKFHMPIFREGGEILLKNGKAGKLDPLVGTIQGYRGRSQGI